MRSSGVVWLCALGACGPSASTIAEHPKPPPEAAHLPSYDVPEATGAYLLAADADAVYWIHDGVWRRPHGAVGAPQHLFATDTELDWLAVGADDVFVVDYENTLRAIPRAGGAPATLATLAGSVWALGADGAAVWVGVDDKLERYGRDGKRTTIPLGRFGTFMTISHGAAFVTATEAPTLVRADLASGQVKPLSEAWWFGSAYGLTVAGDSLMCAYSEGVVAIPTAGGKPQLTFPTSTYALAGDGDGYVVQESSALIDHRRGQAPRIIATSDMITSLAGMTSLAVGGGYVYAFVYDTAKSPDALLRAFPLDDGVELLRTPLDGYLTDLAVDGSSVVVGFEDGDGEHLARVGSRRTRKVFHAQAYIDTVLAADGDVAFSSNGEIYALAKDGQRARRLVGSEVGAPPLAVHKGLVYYAQYGSIYAVPVAGGATVKVLEATALAQIGEYATISGIEFGNDHLYFVITYGGTVGLYSINEERTPKRVWTYPAEYAEPGLAADVAVIDRTAYVHDYTHVWAIDLATGESRVAWKHDDASLTWLDSVGPHLVAYTGGPDGNELIEVMPASGKTHVLWRSYLDGGYVPFFAAGADAVYLASTELFGILKVPVE